MTTSHPRLAIIEDNDDLREELQYFLQQKGYPCWSSNSAESFWKKLHTQPADIILIDLGLPGEDGFSVVDYLQQLTEMGRVIISARGSKEDKHQGLTLGADLYLVKPINFSRLCTQLDELWQRLQNEQASPVIQPGTIPQVQWQLDMAQSSLLTPDGEALRLSDQELALISLLLQQPGEIFSREALHLELFGSWQELNTHRIDVILSRLRKKAINQHIKLPLRVIFGKGITFINSK